MTTPKINTISRRGARFYVNPETGNKAPGVTSIIDMLPKSFLKFWASKSVAENAVEMLPELVGLAIRGKQDAAVDMLKRSPDRDTRQAAETGTEVHEMFDKLAQGKAIGRVHPELQPYVDHFNAWLDACQPDFGLMEETVWSEAHDYAGSFDAYATIDGERCFIDYKTTRSGVHEEVGLQLAAYRHADYVIRPDKTRVPMPGADAGRVLHVRPEGWSFVPVRIDEETFAFFLHLREIFRWEKEFKETVIGDPIAGGEAA